MRWAGQYHVLYSLSLAPAQIVDLSIVTGRTGSSHPRRGTFLEAPLSRLRPATAHYGYTNLETDPITLIGLLINSSLFTLELSHGLVGSPLLRLWIGLGFSS
ncbi:hypothetical protein J6590_075596 [Homalodisca vitripennis]|nr:hypothetical protein J6590_075596 [Homalodisca vitripennis]